MNYIKLVSFMWAITQVLNENSYISENKRDKSDICFYYHALGLLKNKM